MRVKEDGNWWLKSRRARSRMRRPSMGNGRPAAPSTTNIASIQVDVAGPLNNLLAHPVSRAAPKPLRSQVRLAGPSSSSERRPLLREVGLIRVATSIVMPSTVGRILARRKRSLSPRRRNLACSGPFRCRHRQPHFGNPHKPENFLQLREAVEGMAEACRAFNTPVTGGNVSLYNESPAGAIDPTPTVGMVGLIEDSKHITTQFFKQPGDVILLIGDLGNELGASHFLKIVHGRKEGAPPKLDLEKEKRAHDAVRALIRIGLVQSAHDCAEGGLAVALVEASLSGPQVFGAEAEFGETGLRPDVLLFNETQSRIIVSVKKNNATAAVALLEWRGVPARRLGAVSKSDSLKISADGKTLAGRWLNSMRPGRNRLESSCKQRSKTNRAQATSVATP